ncbi:MULTISPECIES: 50S ribosomal protein L25 [unclassified Fibrobacter]|uniref:50S ribosomal protein L25 n=1 Tax=unclassified Fibrobacter TaxID=2634177 RepID=UPI000921A531|nr:MULTISPECIES: 50S ribosomal protein L25 [unclassified Fibrobacter]OWV07255.1 5S rRNA E-loop-binding protein [Fibrobacter sp. UWH3]OWV15878.1 5S rRNA E-loop-binding protein [Fibrobacter sp. UWH1]SHK79681.1 LSU ribosomal protein L25P [Fibrobacter sp. UWH5]SHK81136.1 LSU ribosomal protein L25P [Fibrobacter sp. UWH6]
MELTKLVATSRVQGKSADSKRLRKAGQIPAVYYGKGQEAVNVSVSAIDVRKVLAPGKRYTLLDLVIDGKEGNAAVVYNYQKDPLTQEIIHIDFLKIDETTKVKVRVPVKLNGLPVGVKTQGGTFAQQNRYIQLAAVPTKIPTLIEMDISNYPAPTTFYAKDLPLTEGVELACTPRVVIFNITAKRGAKTEEAQG